MKLLLVDDHPLFAVCFKQALMQAGADIHVDTALTIDDGLSRAAWGHHDMVLIDDRLAGANGSEGIHRFGTTFPLMARVLISGEEDAALAARAKGAGASGYLGKSQSIDQLLANLQAIRRGDALVSYQQTCPTVQPEAWPTARQLQVLALVAQGQPNKRIAGALGICERTVKLHITALLHRLGARNRTHLLIVGRQRGLL